MKVGTYMAVKFCQESNNKLIEIIKSFGLEKDFNDEFHCTITYSKKELVGFKTCLGESTSKLKNFVKIKGFGHFDTDSGKNLHIILECPFCEIEFARAKAAGATFDYDKYTAHVTLMYNCKDFTYSNQGDKFIGNKLIINEEYVETLNENWIDDNKKD